MANMSSACLPDRPGPRPGYYRVFVPFVMEIGDNAETQTVWEIPVRYKDLAWLGSGAFSQVCSAVDEISGKKVAIKKMSKPFQSDVHARRAYREVRILKHMDHENVIKLTDVFTPALSSVDCNNVYIVTELQTCGNLKALIKNHGTQISEDLIKTFVYQMLRGLKYIHSAGVIHRDIKPSNLVLNNQNELKILDFGMARQADATMSGYVATRWYRAPEVLFNWMHYTTNADIWSVGCIMAEMLLGKPLFPGKDFLDHFDKIISVLGSPSKDLMSKFTSKDTKTYIESITMKGRVDFRTLFPTASDDFIDLIEHMLDMDPETRVTAEQALGHPFLRDHSDPEDEPICEVPYDHKEEEVGPIGDSQDVIDKWKKIVFDELRPGTPV